MPIDGNTQPISHAVKLWQGVGLQEVRGEVVGHHQAASLLVLRGASTVLLRPTPLRMVRTDQIQVSHNLGGHTGWPGPLQSTLMVMI